MCRQPATGGGVSPWAKSVCAYECVLILRRGGGGERRGVYVGMRVRIRGRRDRREGKRSKVLLLILPLIQSPQTHTEGTTSTTSAKAVSWYMCVFSALGANRGGSLRIYGWERGVGEPKKRSPSVFCPRGSSHTADSIHTLAGTRHCFPDN